MMNEEKYNQYVEKKRTGLLMRWIEFKSDYKKVTGEELTELKSIYNILRIERDMITDILVSVRNCGYSNENNISPDQLQDVIFQLNCQTWFIMEEINGRTMNDTLNHLTDMYTYIEDNENEE